VTDIQPIETQYAGHRFRSRLEARWAVFFDHLGMQWRYEPEGYEVGPPGRRRRYLPDFYLPADRLWVEVKGFADGLDSQLMYSAAHPAFGLPLSLNDPSVTYSLWDARLLILGPVPLGGGAHDLLAVVRGEVVARQISFVICQSKARGNHRFVPLLWPEEAGPATAMAPDLVSFAEFKLGFGLCEHVRAAYRAARSARFEHGESGAPIAADEGLKRFVESQCVRGAGREIRPVTFRSMYTAWCEARKLVPVTTKDLTKELRRFGVTLSKGRRPRVYLGIATREAVAPLRGCRRCVTGEVHYLEPGCDPPEQEGLDGMNPVAREWRPA
jgi:hypothetical protein